MVKSSQGQIIMEKIPAAAGKPKIEIKQGKMPVVKMPRNAPPLTSELVKEIAQL